MELKKMEDNLVEMLQAEGIRIDAYGSTTEMEFIIDFHDNFGKKGIVSIFIGEGCDKYSVCTSKSKDDYNSKNHKMIKTVSAVKNYIYKFLD